MHEPIEDVSASSQGQQTKNKIRQTAQIKGGGGKGSKAGMNFHPGMPTVFDESMASEDIAELNNEVIE